MNKVEKYVFIQHISGIVQDTYYLMDVLLKDINYKVGDSHRDEWLAAYKMKEGIGDAITHCSRADDFFIPEQCKPMDLGEELG